eukprot:gene22527-33650_t
MPSIDPPPNSKYQHQHPPPPPAPTLDGSTPEQRAAAMLQASVRQELSSSRSATWHGSTTGGRGFAAEAARQLNARRAQIAITSHQHNAWQLQQRQQQQQEQYRQQQQALETQHRQQQRALQQQQEQQQHLEQALRQEMREEEERAIMTHRLAVQRQAEQRRQAEQQQPPQQPPQQQQHASTEEELQALEALLFAGGSMGTGMEDQRAEPPASVGAGAGAGAGAGVRGGVGAQREQSQAQALALARNAAAASVMDSGADDIYSLLFGGRRPPQTNGSIVAGGMAPTSISSARRQSVGDDAHTHTWHDSRPESVRRLSEMIEER